MRNRNEIQGFYKMRAAITRRSLSANEAIDEIDSPIDGLEDGSLSIPSQTTGNVTGMIQLFTSDRNKINVHF